jgi:hypothetical protein
MEVKFNVTGKERKALVNAIAEITGVNANYKGVPTCAYEIGNYTIDRAGTLTGEADSQAELLVESLVDLGYQAELVETGNTPAASEASKVIDGLCIELPKDVFTQAALENLNHLVSAKQTLICKALGVTELPIIITDERVSFPWFAGELDSKDVKAYTQLITALCKMAKTQKRINAKETETDNDKYAFRCFLLRLGFIGAQYKDERKLLLKNLTGSSAFRSGKPVKEEDKCK